MKIKGLKPEPTSLLARRFRRAMYLLGMINKKRYKNCSNAITNVMIKRFYAIRAEKVGRKKSFYLAVKWTAEDVGIYDEKKVSYAVCSALSTNY